MNTFINTIVFVKDIKLSKDFYTEVLGLKVVEDFQTIIFFENHFTIHDGNKLRQTIYGRSPILNGKKGRKNLEIYFETANIEESYKKVVNSKAKIIHPISKQAWGQKVFRFYDPDNHIVEIGEPFHEDNLDKAKTEK